ncbi:MAG: hypothetical protein M3Y04_02495 [Actinomycetota bacterium]|nr:hypothetical protein [Actinomycetota bacterium]
MSVDSVRLAKHCCSQALAHRWADGKIVICGGCFLPYTAFVEVQADPITGADVEVPSWWTGLRARD